MLELLRTTTITILIILLMKRYDYIDKYNFKCNIIKIIAGVALPYHILKVYCTLKLDFYFKIAFYTIILSLLISLIIRNEKFPKILFCTFIINILNILLEHISFNFFSFIPVENLRYELLVITLPLRIFQIGTIYIPYLNLNSLVKVDFRALLCKNKSLKIKIVTHTLINIVFNIIFYVGFVSRRLFMHFTSEGSIKVVSVFEILVILNLLVPYILFLHMYPQLKYNLRNELRDEKRIANLMRYKI